MAWVPHPTAIVTDAWPDLGRLPQPVFHRDELARLKHAKATPARYAQVALVKRVFRGAWLVKATGPRKPYKPRGFPKWRARVIEPVIEEDDD